jgi:DNA polymerase beta palm
MLRMGCLLFFFSSQLTRYRRGKSASNDIDVVFTHPNATSAKGLCARLVERLRSAGLVTHVMREYLARTCLASPYLQHVDSPQTFPDSTNMMRYALHNGTRSRRHSLCTKHPTVVATVGSTSSVRCPRPTGPPSSDGRAQLCFKETCGRLRRLCSFAISSAM